MTLHVLLASSTRAYIVALYHISVVSNTECWSVSLFLTHYPCLTRCSTLWKRHSELLRCAIIPGVLQFVLVGKGGSRQVTLTLGALWDPQPSDHMHVNLSARSLPYVDLTDCGDLKKEPRDQRTRKEDPSR
jgi:hypothetical protein